MLGEGNPLAQTARACYRPPRGAPWAAIIHGGVQKVQNYDLIAK